MKNIEHRIYRFLTVAALLLVAVQTYGYPGAPATQLQVNQGTQPYLWVTPKTLAGWTGGGSLSNVVSTVAIANTNQLWVSGAGTAAANGEYVFSVAAYTGGWIYTNITSATQTNYLSAQFAGVGANGDAMPFWVGPTTNNWGLGTAANPYWYESTVSPIAYWTNQNSTIETADGGPGEGGTGVSPMPTVVFGTNFVLQTNNVWISPAYFAAAFTNGIIYVSQMGNDVLASNLQSAFATCQAAKRFASPGMLIDVLPGTYIDHDLLKNGVNWTFEKGSTIAWDDPVSDLNPKAIFDDWQGAVTSNITGDRIHFSDVFPVQWPSVLTTNPATRLVLKFNNGDLANYSFGANLTGGYYPGYPQIPPQAQNAGVTLSMCPLVYDYNAGYANWSFDLISCATNAPRQMINSVYTGGNGGQYVSAPNQTGGFLWGGGEAHFNFNSIICTNGNTAQVFNSVNNGTTETSCFLNGDFANGVVYWSDSNSLARVWASIKLIQGSPLVESGAADLYYGNGYYYLNGLKVASGGSNPAIGIINVPVAGSFCHNWITLQKVTANSSGSWIAIQAPSINWFNIQNYEDNSAIVQPGIQVLTGTNYFNGGNANITNGTVIQISGGQTTMQGMTMQTAGTNQDVQLLTVTGTNNLTLQGDILHSTAAANSIFATNLLGAWVSGSFQADVAPTNLIHITGTNYYHVNTPL